MTANVKQIVQDGFDAEHDEDTIIMSLFTAGVPFHELSKTFKETAITLGLMVDPKVVSANIKAAVEKADWTGIDEWSDLTAAAARIVEDVDGATQAQVIAKARSFCKDEETTLPNKPKGQTGTRTTGGSKLYNAILALLKANPEATKADAFGVLYPVVGGKSRYANTVYYVNSSFILAKAAALGKSILELSTDMAGQDLPPDPELSAHNVQPGDDARAVSA